MTGGGLVSHVTSFRAYVLLIVFVASFIHLSGPMAALAEPSRPRVNVMIAQVEQAAAEVVIPGDIEARYETNVSFRVGGKIMARYVEVGTHVTADQVIARIAPEGQQADLRSAEAQLSSAKASLAQSEVTLRRQAELIKDRYTTGQSYDQAQQSFKQAQSQVRSNDAQVGIMKEKLSYTELRAGVAGVVTSRDAEVGQVVNEGDVIFKVAQDGPRDAVFNVYETLVAKPPASKTITVALQADPKVKVTATVREIAPTVDSSTGAVKVKASLSQNLPGMALGASVIGMGRLDGAKAIILPWSVLTKWQGSPAVWIIASGNIADPRKIVVERYQDRQLVVASGIEPGERVVIGGIQFLRPGTAVQVMNDQSPADR